MRVVHVTTTAEFVRYILIHDLRRLRDTTQATVVCADGAALADIRAEGFEVETIPIERKLAPFTDLRAIWRLWRLLRRGHVDLVHSYLPKGGLVGQLAAWLARVPARVHSCRGLLYTSHMPWWQCRLFRMTDRVTSALAHRTTYNSRADFDYATSQGLCSPRKARFTGSGIDLSYFARSALPAGTRERFRRELGVSPDARVILTIGRFVVDKGYLELADAVVVVRRHHPEAVFVWIAPVTGGEQGTVPDTVLARPELDGAVVRLPLQSDPRPYYAAADLLVHPSHREGVPRVLMEAAAMGVRIVASDIAGCREVVEHGVTGWLHPARDAAGLAESILHVLSLGETFETVTTAASAHVRSTFSQKGHTNRIRDVYREVLA